MTSILRGSINRTSCLHWNLASSIDAPKGTYALHVELKHCYRFASEFNVRRAMVLGVTPYVPPSDG